MRYIGYTVYPANCWIQWIVDTYLTSRAPTSKDVNSPTMTSSSKHPGGQRTSDPHPSLQSARSSLWLCAQSSTSSELMTQGRVKGVGDESVTQVLGTPKFFFSLEPSWRRKNFQVLLMCACVLYVGLRGVKGKYRWLDSNQRPFHYE